MKAFAMFACALLSFLRTIVSKGNFRKAANASPLTALDPVVRYAALNLKMKKTAWDAALTPEQAMEQAQQYCQVADEYQRLVEELTFIDLSDLALNFTITDIQGRQKAALMLASSRMLLAMHLAASKPVIK